MQRYPYTPRYDQLLRYSSSSSDQSVSNDDGGNSEGHKRSAKSGSSNIAASLRPHVHNVPLLKMLSSSAITVAPRFGLLPSADLLRMIFADPQASTSSSRLLASFGLRPMPHFFVTSAVSRM